MYCHKCGAKLDNDEVFCHKCGIKTIVLDNNNDGSKNEGHEECLEKKPVKVIAILIIAILLVVSILVLLTNRILSINQFKENISLGEKYLSELRYDDAIAVFEAAIDIDPKSETAYEGLIKAYIGKGDFEKALELAEKGIPEVNDPDALYELKETIEGQISGSSSSQKKEEAGETENDQDKGADLSFVIPERNKPMELYHNFSEADYEDWQKKNIVLGIPYGANVLDVIDALNDRGFEIDTEADESGSVDDRDDLFALKSSDYDPSDYPSGYDEIIRIITKVPELFPGDEEVKADIVCTGGCLEEIILSISANPEKIDEIFKTTYTLMRKEYGEPLGVTTGSEVPNRYGNVTNPTEVYYWYTGKSFDDSRSSRVALVKEKFSISIHGDVDAGLVEELSSENRTLLEGHDFDNCYEAYEYIRRVQSGEIDRDLPEWASKYKEFITTYFQDLEYGKDINSDELISDETLKQLAYEWAYGEGDGDHGATDVKLAQIVDPWGYLGVATFRDNSQKAFIFNKATGVWIDEAGQKSTLDIDLIKEGEVY